MEPKNADSLRITVLNNVLASHPNHWRYTNCLIPLVSVARTFVASAASLQNSPLFRNLGQSDKFLSLSRVNIHFQIAFYGT